jgi:hypothetical protein
MHPTCATRRSTCSALRRCSTNQALGLTTLSPKLPRSRTTRAPRFRRARAPR